MTNWDIFEFDSIGEAVEMIKAYEEDLENAEAESDRRLALLEDMENERIILGRACLICGAGHTANCELAEEIAQAQADEYIESEDAHIVLDTE